MQCLCGRSSVCLGLAVGEASGEVLNNAEPGMVSPEESLDVPASSTLASGEGSAHEAISSKAQALQEQDCSEQKPEVEPISIDKDALKGYVGQPPFTSDRIYDATPPGVVMGLAW